MGGMLATRYALLYPRQVERLVLVNSIGLEDWKALGVPWRSVDDWYRRDLQTSAEGIRQYQQSHLLRRRMAPRVRSLGTDAGRHVSRQRGAVGGLELGADLRHDLHPAGGLNWTGCRCRPLLLIGEKDNTAIGKDAAPAGLESQAGQLRATGQGRRRRIPQATLVEFPDLGHTRRYRLRNASTRHCWKGLQTQP